MPASHSLTVTAQGGLLNVIQSACHISEAFDPDGTGPIPDHNEFKAIWDTGATASVISQKVVDLCVLKPIGMTQVHGVNGLHTSEVYLVNILLPNHVGFIAIPVTKGILGGDSDVLIGMDIITKGDFVITNRGNTVFSFRVPSQVTIDFVQEHNKAIRHASQTHGGSSKAREKKPKSHGKRKK